MKKLIWTMFICIVLLAIMIFAWVLITKKPEYPNIPSEECFYLYSNYLYA